MVCEEFILRIAAGLVLLTVAGIRFADHFGPNRFTIVGMHQTAGGIVCGRCSLSGRCDIAMYSSGAVRHRVVDRWHHFDDGRVEIVPTVLHRVTIARVVRRYGAGFRFRVLEHVR